MVALSHEESTLITLPWFHFIQVVTFTSDSIADDRAMLSALLTSQRYEDAYEGPSGLGDGRHGPYVLDQLSVESFQPRTADAVQAQIRAWLALVSDSPDTSDPEANPPWRDPTIESAVSQHVFSVLDVAASLYQLAVPQAAEGPEWRVFRADGFHEFAAIHLGRHRLTLIVCTDD